MTVTDATDPGTDPLVQRCRGFGWDEGSTPFDCTWISEIAENLWQGGSRPGLRLPNFVDHIVRLFPSDGEYIVTHGLRSYLTVEFHDSEESSCEGIDAIAEWVNHQRQNGAVLVHCSAGMNRSGLVAARALMLNGATADEAISLLRTQRSPAVLHNPGFVEWLRSI